MVDLFGQQWTRAELERHYPDVTRVFGVEHLTVADGPAQGTRSLRIEAGGGLRVEILPDRLCDIGAVWCDGVPFHWSGPLGAASGPQIGGNTGLYGLLQTCGFDHIRQPERVAGVDYPLHGGMLHMRSRVLSAGPVWEGDDLTFRIDCTAHQFCLGGAALELTRRIDMPCGARRIIVSDRLRVRGASVPVMAMYHVNLGFPLAQTGSSLHVDGEDVTAELLGTDGILTRPSGTGRNHVRLTGTAGAAFDLHYDGAALPTLQTLRNLSPGTGLVCIEPATHPRRPRQDLHDTNRLAPLPTGSELQFDLELGFSAR